MFDPDFDPTCVKPAELYWRQGPYGRPEVPPAKITEYVKKCRDGELKGPIDMKFDDMGATIVLQHYLELIKEWTDKTVSARRLGDKSNIKERAHPLFHKDPFATSTKIAEELRDLQRHDKDEEPPTKRQLTRLSAIVKGCDGTPDAMTLDDIDIAKDYCRLSESEYARLGEMQQIYDGAACYFLQYMLAPNLKKKVNAARVKATSAGKPFGWISTREYLSTCLTSTVNEGTIIDTLILERDDGEPIDVWLANVETSRAVMTSDTKLAERTWIRILVSQLGPDERLHLKVALQSEKWNWNEFKDSIENCDPQSFPKFKRAMITDRYGLKVKEIHDALRFFRKHKGKAPAPAPAKPAQLVCTYCKRKGHLEQDCRKKKADEAAATGGDDARRGTLKQARVTFKDGSDKNGSSSVDTHATVAVHESAKALAAKDLPNFRQGSLRSNLVKRITENNPPSKEVCRRCGGEHQVTACTTARQKWEDDFEKADFWETVPKDKFQQRTSVARPLHAVKASFLAGRVLVARATPVARKTLLFGLDTYSDVNTSPEHLLDHVLDIEPIEVEGTNGIVVHSKIGYMTFRIGSRGITVQFLVADNTPCGVDAMLGMPGLSDLKVSLDRHMSTRHVLRFDDCPSSTRPLEDLNLDDLLNDEVAEQMKREDSDLLSDDAVQQLAPDTDLAMASDTDSHGRSDARSAGFRLLVCVMAYLIVLWASFATPSQAMLPGSPGSLPPVDLNTPLPVFTPDPAVFDDLAPPEPPTPKPHFRDPPSPLSQRPAKSVFAPGQAVRATSSILSPVTRSPSSATLGLDTFSDVNLTRRDLLWNTRSIRPDSVEGTGGTSTFYEQGDVAIQLGGEVIYVPALAATAAHLPSDCDVLLGVPGIRQLGADITHHLDHPRSELQCRLGEKPLRRWLDHNNLDNNVESQPFNIAAVDINPALPADTIQRVREFLRRHARVFEGSKDSLPKPFKGPPVELCFKADAKPVSVPEPKWTHAYKAIITKWAEDGLRSGALEPSKSAWASRPHIVKKAPAGVHPDDADIADCKLRVTGDYRQVNNHFQKIVPNLPTGTDELQRASGHLFYFESDAHACYNAFPLAPGRSREALAIWTPLGLLQPTVLPFGQKNAGTHAQGPFRMAMADLPIRDRDHLANYVDDFIGFDDDLSSLCEAFGRYLSVCDKHGVTLNPHKTKFGYASADFFGFTADKDGTHLAEKHLNPIENMVPPTDIHEVRRVRGIFEQSRRYIPNFAHIMEPLVAICRGSKPEFRWGEEQQIAFDTIRDALLSGIHLHPPNYDLPFHYYSDASEDGKGGMLCQYPEGKEHVPDNALIISYFSKAWQDSERNKPPFYLEAAALLWGIEKCRFYALSSPFPLYTYSDHLPLRWMDKSEKGAVSSFLVEQLSDIERVHTYIEGDSNYVSDAVSRYPMLGPRRVAPRGLAQSISDLLSRLPERLKTSKDVHVHAGPNTAEASRIVQAWRTATNPINRLTPSPTRPPAPADLAVYAPPVERTPQLVARLLCSNTPFAVLMPIDLALEVLDSRAATKAELDHELLRQRFDSAGKVTILATQMMWIIGNVPELQQTSATYSTVMSTPAPLLESFAAIADIPAAPVFDVPRSLEQWIEAQMEDPDRADGIPPEETVTRDGLTLHISKEYEPRIIVPEANRENLIRQHHSDLFHLGPDKTAHSLRKSYYWPKLEATVRKTLADCAGCELAKARRNAAHAMFRDRPLAGPRARLCMDFQGQTKAKTGEVEACAIIDEFSRFVVVIPLHSQAAAEFTPKFADAVLFSQGPPDIIHSDAAKVFLSTFQKCLVEVYGIHRTTSLGHNPTGNAMVEIFWRYWNRCMRLLSDEQIRHWPQYAARICFAHNTAIHDSISATPFELHHGVPARNPFAPALRPDLDAVLPDADFGDPVQFAAAVRESVTAFTALARDHSNYVQRTTADRMNQHGFQRTYEVGDRVKVMVPPSAKQIEETGRPAKHLDSWRGPCEVIEKLSDTAYAVRELATNRRFERTVINLARYRAVTPGAPPSREPFVFVPDEILAVRDHPQSDFYIATAVAATNDVLTVHYFGSRSGNLARAVFRRGWSHAQSRTITLSATHPAGCSPWTGELDIDALDVLIVARNLTLTSGHRLTAPSRIKLAPIANELHVFPRN